MCAKVHLPELNESALRFPNALLYLEFSIYLGSGCDRHCETVDFWACTLRQNRALEKVCIWVTYTKHALDLSSAEIGLVASLDRALVERVGYLHCVDLLVPPTDWDSDRVEGLAKRMDDWLFEAAFPNVTKKFFAGMPEPKPGDVHKGLLAIRQHTSYIRYPDDSDSDDE